MTVILCGVAKVTRTTHLTLGSLELHLLVRWLAQRQHRSFVVRMSMRTIVVNRDFLIKI